MRIVSRHNKAKTLLKLHWNFSELPMKKHKQVKVMKKYNASSEGFWSCCDVILRKSIHHFSNCSSRFAGGYMSFDRFRIETCHLCSAFDVAKSHQSPETLFFHVSQWDEIFLFHFHGLAFSRDILACHKKRCSCPFGTIIWDVDLGRYHENVL